MNLSTDVFDKADLIWRICERNVTTLTLTVTVSDPYKQVPDTKGYLEPSQKSTMELFTKIVNSYFGKKPYRRCSTRSEIRLWDDMSE